ncbi:hypothetical protein EC957_004259 [Mortierella hygrophila]|uniref:Uncharacterized protein n=1 Tax=Mortierella hygrophila TaxID=979708 RepID=A0A9P6FF12_9FUNG|nr:hypothetical protein EC957_004259 [Mortierella hygrophila]
MVKFTSYFLISLSASLLALSGSVEAKADLGACFLKVPKNPLTAHGLASAYILKKGNCDQTIADQQVFVEATVFDLDAKTFSVYHPLVINEGTKPAIAPVVPKLPTNFIVGLWFGANSNSVTLTGDIKDCVNGLSSTDIFSQVAFCNAHKFFQAVQIAKDAGELTIPPLGKDPKGNPCPTTRHFGIIDQDQSDNVITTYLQSKSGHFSQATKANRNKIKEFTEISNGSDNALVADFLDPQLKCQPFKAPSLMESGVKLGSMALNELHASHQHAPVALIPSNDPMVLSNNKPSLAKLNAYRRGVTQHLASNLNQASSKAYCINFGNVAPGYIQKIAKFIIGGPSPDTGAANNLLTFMGQRYAASWVNLGCDKILKKTSDITVTTDKKGVAIKVHFHQSKPIKK